MIWHIFKKDWKLLWPLVVIVAAAHVINAAMWFVLGYFEEPIGLRAIANTLPIAVLLGIVFLIVTAVHQDPLPGDRQDWLVRPIYRRDLVLAKLLFIVIAVQAPMLLVDLTQCMATGFSFWDSLSAALSRNGYVLLCVSLPMLGLAAMTSTIVEVIVSALAIFLTIVVFTLVTQASTPNWDGALVFEKMSQGWLMLELDSAVMLATAATIIPLQYFRRATIRARGITVSAILVLFLVSALLPWTSAFAFLQWLSPDPAAANAVAMAFDPTLEKLALKPGTLNPANSVWIPLHVSGLAPDSIVLNDRAFFRIIGRDGAILFAGLSTSAPQARVVSSDISLDIDDFPVRTNAGGDVRTHQLIALPPRIYELVRSEPVRIELDYALTLFQIEASGQVAALDGSKRIAKLGLCRTKINNKGNGVDFACLTTREAPTCATFVLHNAVTRQQNPALNLCTKFYLPYNAHFQPDAMVNFARRLPFRDPQGWRTIPWTARNSQMRGCPSRPISPLPTSRASLLFQKFALAIGRRQFPQQAQAEGPCNDGELRQFVAQVRMTAIGAKRPLGWPGWNGRS